MDPSASRKPEIKISQKDSKRVTALVAHYRQIQRATLREDGSIIRPIDLDHMEVLLASASLRALFFDDSPSAQFFEFANQHDIQINIETVSTTSAMILFSQVTAGNELHLSDLIANILLNPAVGADFSEGISHAFFAILQESHEVVKQIGAEQQSWAPASPEFTTKTNSTICYQPGLGISQYANITRRIVNLKEWGDQVVGMLADIPIRRRSIVCFVANKLGGVHYDSRFSAKAPYAREFRALTESYDWKSEAVVHAGLVMVFLSCLELIKSEELHGLFLALEKFHSRRQARLRSGTKLTENDSQNPEKT